MVVHGGKAYAFGGIFADGTDGGTAYFCDLNATACGSPLSPKCGSTVAQRGDTS